MLWNGLFFSAWCQDRELDPVTSDVSVVLSFLQEMLDKQRASVQFLRGAKRVNPSRRRTVPPWDLPTVLRALKGPPFEQLQSTSLRALSFKTALLLALAQVKRVGDLQALSINPACIEFRPNDSKVFLKPRLGYVPKVLSTPFRAQVIALSALSPSAWPGIVPALPRQGLEGVHYAFCFIQEIRTAFCRLR